MFSFLAAVTTGRTTMIIFYNSSREIVPMANLYISHLIVTLTTFYSVKN